MKRNVLIVSRDFAPCASASARRATKLAKYLTRAGFEVTVLTGDATGAKDPLLRADLSGGCGRVLRAGNVPVSIFSRLFFRFRRFRKAEETGASLRREQLRPSAEASVLVNFLRSEALARRAKKQERAFYRAALAYVSRAGLDLSHFDVMISTFSPLSSHMVALALKAKCPTLSWIADFREAPPSVFPSSLVRFHEKWIRRVLVHCDTLSAASGSVIKDVCPKKLRLRTAIIPNGFDEEDLLGIPQIRDGEKRPFTISITPPLDLARFDLSVLFSAVSDLIKSGRIRRDQIVFEYYGAQALFDSLSKAVEEMDLPPLFYNRGKASRLQVLSAECRAQLLVCPAADTRAERGEIPEKFFEALL